MYKRQISNESHFDNYSRDNRTYVKADSFSKFVKNDMDEELSNKPLNEQIELLGTYLKDKLIVVNPYYYFKSDSEAVSYTHLHLLKTIIYQFVFW